MRREPTARELASLGAKDQKKRGSVEWCWQAIGWLKTLYDSSRATRERWEQALRDIEDQRVWEKVPPSKPYGSMEAMFKAELGATPEEAGAKVAARAMNPKSARTNSESKVGNRNAAKERGENDGDHGNRRSRGNDATYLTARIARDFPAVHERMKRGEFKSVRAAAVEAGIVRPRKPRTNVTGDVPTVSPPASGRAVSMKTVKTIIEEVAPALRPADAKMVVEAAMRRLEPQDIDRVARRIVPTVESATLVDLLREMISRIDEDEALVVAVLAAKRLGGASLKKLTRFIERR